MDVIVERPSALDVHKASVTACVRVPGERGARQEHIAHFSTTVQGLLSLRDWLAAHRVTQVTMEATGVYWKPVWAILEDDFELILGRRRHHSPSPGIISGGDLQRKKARILLLLSLAFSPTNQESVRDWLLRFGNPEFTTPAN